MIHGVSVPYRLEYGRRLKDCPIMTENGRIDKIKAGPEYVGDEDRAQAAL